MTETQTTASERFASKIVTALGASARVQYSGPSEEGTQLTFSETETGQHFTVIVSSDVDED